MVNGGDLRRAPSLPGYQQRNQSRLGLTISFVEAVKPVFLGEVFVWFFAHSGASNEKAIFVLIMLTVLIDARGVVHVNAICPIAIMQPRRFDNLFDLVALSGWREIMVQRFDA